MKADRARLDALEAAGDGTHNRMLDASTLTHAPLPAVDAATRRVDEALVELKRLKPETVDEQRKRAVELVRLRQAASCS